MKKTTKILILAIFCLILLSIFYTVNAASATVKASKSNATVGDTVNITVSIYAATWNVSVSGSGISDTIVGYNEDGVNTSKSKTYSLNTSSTGTYTIYISGDVTDESSDYSSPVSDSTTVTISSSSGGGTSPTPSSKSKTSTTTETKKSDDSKLKALSVAEGTISPEFSSDITEYTLTIPNETTEISVAATTNSSKATYAVEGNKELKVGENTVTVTVRAEDGSNSIYTIIVTRAKAELSLQSLKISYTDENGVIKELVLNPIFNFDILEYTLEQLPYTIDKLDIEALANLEGAIVNIEGNEYLETGENKIIITITLPAELSETGEVIKPEEIKTYTITVNKEAEPVPPTTWQKIKNWFNGVFGGVNSFVNDNFNTVLGGAIAFCTVALFGLSIYLFIDYKKYKTLLVKIKQLSNLNSSEIATENIDKNDFKLENIEEKTNIQEVEPSENIIEEDNLETKKKTGRHF